jgi:uncharacterized membrane protein YfcA
MRRSLAPISLMGLANAVFGMYGGIMVISVPQLLSARHVPESTIAAMTAVMLACGAAVQRMAYWPRRMWICDRKNKRVRIGR